MILGSAIAEHIDGVWAGDIVENVAPGVPRGLQEIEEEPELKDIVYGIDNTTTRALSQIPICPLREVPARARSGRARRGL